MQAVNILETCQFIWKISSSSENNKNRSLLKVMSECVCFRFSGPSPTSLRNLTSVLPLDLICSFSYFKFITFWKILKTFHASHTPKKQKGTCLTEPFPPSAVFQNSHFQQHGFKMKFVFCFCLTRLKYKIVWYSILQ